MKILLIGDFSALHNNLKDGLIELGHEPILISRGDGFKKISSDISLDSIYRGIIGKFDSGFLRPMSILPHLEKADIVQLINPFYFQRRFFPNKFFLKLLASRSGKFFFLAAGDDAYYWTVSRQKLKYGPFDDILTYDLNKAYHDYETKASLSLNENLLRNSNGVIPIMYEYDIGYLDLPNKMPIIPLPLNTNKIEYTENKLDGKIRIFHGLNRYGFKGTRYVEEAFEILRQKYPNDVELSIDGKMSLDQYINVLKKSHIVIDQTSSYSLGMNALYAMAMGKVLLGGAEPESLSAMGIKSSPVINILPNAQSIVNAVEYILENKELIHELGYQSRKYVENYHDHINIAEKYLKVWNDN